MITGPSVEPAPDGSEMPLDGSLPIETTKERLFRASVWTMIIVLLVRSPALLALIGWFTDAYQEAATSSKVSHRLHEVVFGILFSLALVGAITQLVGAKRNLAGLIQLTVTLVTLSFVITSTVDWDFGLLVFLIPLAGVLVFASPTKPFRSGPIWGWAAALTLIAIPPFLGEIEGQVGRALTEAQNHTTHWSTMAAFALVLLLLGGVVALRVTGYRIVAMSISGAAAGYGLASLVFPFDASSHRFGYAVGLIIWAVGWLFAVLFLDRPVRDNPRPLVLKVVGWIILAPVILIVSVIWSATDDQPNVPHSPDPNNPTVTAAAVDRSTCLECHASGVVGAPMVPHEFDRRCGDEPCWGGRSDCAGCHQIDPRLGGPKLRIETAAWGPLLVEQRDAREVVPLAPEDLALIRVIGVVD